MSLPVEIRTSTLPRTILRSCHPLAFSFALGAAACALAVRAQNIASSGQGIIGYQAAVDGTPGTLLYHVGAATDITDGDLGTHVDNWSAGSDQGQGVSFVGVVWPSARYEQISKLTLTLAAFLDGGWFGPNGTGPGAGGALLPEHLTEPVIQVSTNRGASWQNVTATSDYLTALNGATIGGGDNPNPNTLTATFTLSTPVSKVDGIRIIGPNGGNAGADANGFLGVFDLDIQAAFTDSDNDGLPDAWEQAFGLNVGVNDAGVDSDGDSVLNTEEYAHGINPSKTDSDGDGLNDGDELNVSRTSPSLADTDGDGVNDGDEVNKYLSDPLLTDSDNDGLSDGDEVTKYHTNPVLADTDGDGYGDSVEVSLGSNPNDSKSLPGNLALGATGLLGTEDNWGGTDTPLFHVGGAENINDGIFTSRVDTYNDAGTDKLSFVGVAWDHPLTEAVARLKLTLATFFDGGWFGPNGKGPGAGNPLTAAQVSEPTIQVSSDGGTTWTNVDHASDYLTVMIGHRVGGGTQPNPTAPAATFTLKKPVSGINAVRIIGTEGGTASGGFLGVFELQVYGFTDTDKDGMDDNWEKENNLKIGTNDAGVDADLDGLTNLQEYNLGTNPQKPDSDSDGVKDGDEVNTSRTNPLASDSDSDGLSDGEEINVRLSNPLSADSDGDGFADGLEAAVGTELTLPSSFPSNLALRLDANPIIGTEDVPGGTDTPFGQAGSPASINDNDLNTHVDTWNGNQPTSADTASYVGILWTNLVNVPISSLELTLAAFGDGGWFGVNGLSPAPGGALTSDHLTEPTVQATTNGGVSWTPISVTSDYSTTLLGATIGGGANPNPKNLAARFTLSSPMTNINGIRLVGTEGGLASGGFLGVAELKVLAAGPKGGVTLAKAAIASGKFQFEFDSQSGTTYTVQFKNSLSDRTWQTLSSIAGDGARKSISDWLTSSNRFYRVSSQ